MSTLSSGTFTLRADIEDQISCTVSARDGLSIRDVLAEKLENTGGRRWENFLVFTKYTRVHIEWEMNVSCVRGHNLIIVNRLDPTPRPLPGAHHFLSRDLIKCAAGPYAENDFHYIIRPSGKNLGSFALVITTPSSPNNDSCLRHVTISYDKEIQKFSLCSKLFETLDELVQFFKRTPINARGGPSMYLRYPIPVDPRLEEECKQRWRLTRTGERELGSQEQLDTISLWSCSSSATVNSFHPTLSSYESYDGSISGQSEDDLHPHYDAPFSRTTKTATVIGDNVLSASSGYVSNDSSSDVIRRGQSNSSSGTSSSSTSAVGPPPAGRNKAAGRPQSEFLQRKRCSVDQQKRSCSLAPHFQMRPLVSQKSVEEPEATYVTMEPAASPGTQRRPLLPGQKETALTGSPFSNHRTMKNKDLTLETLKRTHPIVGDEESRTLTRDQSADEGPCDTYVEMGTLARPRQHTYVNSPVSPEQQTPCSPIQQTPCSPVQQTPCSPVALYHNVPLAPLDHDTAQKLVANVCELMSTVKVQGSEILTLKKTIKELKLKVQMLQDRQNSQGI